MKCVMTGATGFIGKNLKHHLEQKGWSVRTLGRADSQTAMIELMMDFKPDVVFHLASLFIAEHKTENIPDLVQSNVLFGSQVVEAMAKAGVRRLVNTGTSWQHFDDRAVADVDDVPVCFYAATKSAFEEILKYYVSAENFHVTTLAIYDTYGLQDTRGKILSKLISLLGARDSLALSPGAQRLNFVNVKDVVIAFEQAALQLIGDKSTVGAMRTFSISADEELSLRELVKMIESLSGKSIPIEWGARPYRKREVMQPWSGEPRVPGWKASINLKDGIKEMLNATI